MAKSIYNDKYKTIRVKLEDYNDLMVISKKSGVSLINLINFATPMLKRKYRIKEVGDGK